VQERRAQRSLERAQAPVFKKNGKPVMFRSKLVAAASRAKRQKEAVRENIDEDLKRYLEVED
jgi:hypothetical protein